MEKKHSQRLNFRKKKKEQNMSVADIYMKQSGVVFGLCEWNGIDFLRTPRVTKRRTTISYCFLDLEY